MTHWKINDHQAETKFVFPMDGDREASEQSKSTPSAPTKTWQGDADHMSSQ